jgi:hypothetical protein
MRGTDRASAESRLVRLGKRDAKLSGCALGREALGDQLGEFGELLFGLLHFGRQAHEERTGAIGAIQPANDLKDGLTADVELTGHLLQSDVGMIEKVRT